MRNVKGDVRGKDASSHELIFPEIEFTADGLMIGIETPRELMFMESIFEFGKNGTMGHTLHTGTLVTLRNFTSNKREWDFIQLVIESLKYSRGEEW